MIVIPPPVIDEIIDLILLEFLNNVTFVIFFGEVKNIILGSKSIILQAIVA